MKIDFICVGCSLLPLLSLIFCNQTTIKLDKIEILANLCNFKFLELGQLVYFSILFGFGAFQRKVTKV